MAKNTQIIDNAEKTSTTQFNLKKEDLFIERSTLEKIKDQDGKERFIPGTQYQGKIFSLDNNKTVDLSGIIFNINPSERFITYFNVILNEYKSNKFWKNIRKLIFSQNENGLIGVNQEIDYDHDGSIKISFLLSLNKAINSLASKGRMPNLPTILSSLSSEQNLASTVETFDTTMEVSAIDISPKSPEAKLPTPIDLETLNYSPESEASTSDHGSSDSYASDISSDYAKKTKKRSIVGDSNIENDNSSKAIPVQYHYTNGKGNTHLLFLSALKSKICILVNGIVRVQELTDQLKGIQAIDIHIAEINTKLVIKHKDANALQPSNKLFGNLFEDDKDLSNFSISHAAINNGNKQRNMGILQFILNVQSKIAEECCSHFKLEGFKNKKFKFEDKEIDLSSMSLNYAEKLHDHIHKFLTSMILFLPEWTEIKTITIHAIPSQSLAMSLKFDTPQQAETFFNSFSKAQITRNNKEVEIIIPGRHMTTCFKYARERICNRNNYKKPSNSIDETTTEVSKDTVSTIPTSPEESSNKNKRKAMEESKAEESIVKDQQVNLESFKKNHQFRSYEIRAQMKSAMKIDNIEIISDQKTHSISIIWKINKAADLNVFKETVISQLEMDVSINEDNHSVEIFIFKNYQEIIDKVIEFYHNGIENAIPPSFISQLNLSSMRTHGANI